LIERFRVAARTLDRRGANQIAQQCALGSCEFRCALQRRAVGLARAVFQRDHQVFHFADHQKDILLMQSAALP
jgi:hypothetical protein